MLADTSVTGVSRYLFVLRLDSKPITPAMATVYPAVRALRAHSTLAVLVKRKYANAYTVSYRSVQ